MKLIAVNCNNCGGPLEVAEDTRFVSCGRCGSQLAVEHHGAAAFTRRVADLEQRTGRLEHAVETVRLQGELDRLERDWTERQRREESETNRSGSKMSWQAYLALGSGGLGVALLKLDSGETIAAGVVLIIVGALFAWWALAKTRSVSGDELVYRTRRRALVSQLKAAGRSRRGVFQR